MACVFMVQPQKLVVLGFGLEGFNRSDLVLVVLGVLFYDVAGQFIAVVYEFGRPEDYLIQREEEIGVFPEQFSEVLLQLGVFQAMGQDGFEKVVSLSGVHIANVFVVLFTLSKFLCFHKPLIQSQDIPQEIVMCFGAIEHMPECWPLEGRRQILQVYGHNFLLDQILELLIFIDHLLPLPPLQHQVILIMNLLPGHPIKCLQQRVNLIIPRLLEDFLQIQIEHLQHQVLEEVLFGNELVQDNTQIRQDVELGELHDEEHFVGGGWGESGGGDIGGKVSGTQWVGMHFWRVTFQKVSIVTFTWSLNRSLLSLSFCSTLPIPQRLCLNSSSLSHLPVQLYFFSFFLKQKLLWSKLLWKFLTDMSSHCFVAFCRLLSSVLSFSSTLGLTISTAWGFSLSRLQVSCAPYIKKSIFLTSASPSYLSSLFFQHSISSFWSFSQTLLNSNTVWSSSNFSSQFLKSSSSQQFFLIILKDTCSLPSGTLTHLSFNTALISVDNRCSVSNFLAQHAGISTYETPILCTKLASGSSFRGTKEVPFLRALQMSWALSMKQSSSLRVRYGDNRERIQETLIMHFRQRSVMRIIDQWCGLLCRRVRNICSVIYSWTGGGWGGSGFFGKYELTFWSMCTAFPYLVSSYLHCSLTSSILGMSASFTKHLLNSSMRSLLSVFLINLTSLVNSEIALVLLRSALYSFISSWMKLQYSVQRTLYKKSSAQVLLSSSQTLSTTAVDILASTIINLNGPAEDYTYRLSSKSIDLVHLAGLLGHVCLLIIEPSFLQLLQLRFTQSPFHHRRVNLLGVILINRLQLQHPVSIHMNHNLDGRCAFRGGRNFGEFECPENVVVLDQLVLAFVDGHQDHLLVVLGGGEGVVADCRDRRVVWDYYHHGALWALDAQRDWHHVDQQERFLLLRFGVTGDVLSQQCSTENNGLVRVDRFVGLLAGEEFLNEVGDHWGVGGSTCQDDLIDAFGFEFCVFYDLVDESDSLSQNRLANSLPLIPRDLIFESLALSQVLQLERRLFPRGQRPPHFGALGFEILQCLPIALQIDPSLLVELLRTHLDQPIIEVLCPEMRIPHCRQNLYEAILYRHYRRVECSSTQFIHQQLDFASWEVRTQSVGHGSGGGLVDKPRNRQAGEVGGVAGGLPLAVSEVRGDGYDCFLYCCLQELLGGLLQADQDHSCKLLGVELFGFALVGYHDFWAAQLIGLHFEGPLLHVFLQNWILKGFANHPLEVKNGVVRVFSCECLCLRANKPLGLGEGYVTGVGF